MYPIPKTPIYRAKDLKLGTRRKGRDGKMWYVSSKNGSKYWSSSNNKKSMRKIYGGSKTAKPKTINKSKTKTSTQKKDSGSKTAKSKTITKKKSDRKGPPESATLFKVGTIKKGNNDKLWIIKETTNGTKRWVQHKDVSKHKESNKSLNVAKKTKKRKTTKWDVLVRKRKKELSEMKTTKSYTPRSRLSNTTKEYYVHDNGARP